MPPGSLCNPRQPLPPPSPTFPARQVITPMPSPPRSNTFGSNRIERATMKSTKAPAKRLDIASRPALTGSNGPIVDAKPGNLAEVGQILREEQRIVRKRDGGDSQIHRSEAQLQTDQPLKF